MTMQLPDLLRREEDAVALPDLGLHGVFIGDVRRTLEMHRYPLKYKCNRHKATPCTALWRGYVATYSLFADGRLVLEMAHYPSTPDVEPDFVNEELAGDFWLEMREGFFGAVVRIPFVDGRRHDGGEAIGTLGRTCL